MLSSDPPDTGRPDSTTPDTERDSEPPTAPYSAGRSAAKGPVLQPPSVAPSTLPGSDRGPASEARVFLLRPKLRLVKPKG